MTQQYFNLDLCLEIQNDTDLIISRTKKLLEAVRWHRDYTFIKLMRFPINGDLKAECIIVDVECDGVPPKNTVGIQYRERLALLVSNRAEHLVEVYALRKDFPILMHQNQRLNNLPASLCLYFEPSSSVLRTWTPQKFLRRIQWWLEKSAIGELHPTDQPVEHLFFRSKYELILPHNFEELQVSHSSFTITRGSKRQNGGFSCFLHVNSNNNINNVRLKYIKIELPPILHGIVETDPSNLGELFELLANRNINLLDRLKSVLYESVDEKGINVDDDQGTLILLHIPICRTINASPEKYVYRAFLTEINIFDLGVSLNILIKYDNKYYRNIVVFESHQSINDTKWQQFAIDAVEVLKINDCAIARKQSGISEDGPIGILIGVGSLGSALINLWGRSGWGQWTIVDKDHIKPHNLSRHTTFVHHIGEPKASCVAELHSKAVDNASILTSLVADAIDLIKDPTSNILRTSTVIVDASTTLEYPRAASMDNSLSRHISIFITPDGNGAVLMAEDTQRTIRLRTLEAQYYRTLIQNDLGKIHLANTVNTFWSGTGCRDISVILPYSCIMVHASTLAEQIQKIIPLSNAFIRIWQREPNTGSISVHDILAQSEKCIPLDELNVFIDSGVEQDLFNMRKQCLPNETGGVLLGYYDFNIQAIMIVSALSAPSDSKATPSSFERGTNGLAEIVQQAADRTMGIVSYIGEWHSHPSGSSTSMSNDDIIQLSFLTQEMAEDGLPAISLIVGDKDFQVYKGKLYDK